MSSLAWIDFDEAERPSAQHFMALFQERVSRDELGLHAIRDSIVDHLFSGASSLPKGLVESFNGLMRDDLLDETLLFVLEHACQTLAAWTLDYNTHLPHSWVGYQTPAAYAAFLIAIGRPASPLESSGGRPVFQRARRRNQSRDSARRRVKVQRQVKGSPK
jgi:hypothetical protein